MSEQNDNAKVENGAEAEGWKIKAEEYLNNWKRERADFLNYRKDEAERIAEFVKFANESLVLEVIDILDDLELAAKQAADGGLTQIIKKFGELLRKYGVEKIRTDGQFDPSLHEAVESETGGEQLEEVRSGFTMHKKVIRPARVRIGQL